MSEAVTDFTVRDEEPRDAAAVRAVTDAAFEGPLEASLVERLRAADAVAVSLVAESAEGVIGHILFTPVAVLRPGFEQTAVGLGPMCVAPERQRSGVGSRLVREGIDRCRGASHGAIVVLGHPEYYPRFGFRPAGRFGLRCAFDVPPEVFMALELVPGSLHGDDALVTYHAEFDNTT